MINRLVTVNCRRIKNNYRRVPDETSNRSKTGIGKLKTTADE